MSDNSRPSNSSNISISNSNGHSTLATASLSRDSTTGSISMTSSTSSLGSAATSGLLSKPPSSLMSSSRSISGTSAGRSGSGMGIGMGLGLGIGGSSLGGSGSGTSSSSAAVSSSSENLPPRTLARVARDVRDLVKSPPEGVRLVLDGETGMPGSLSEILAEIEGPEQTPYHTRYFQLKLCLSTDFPSTPPRGYFLTKIYHPNVDPTTGAICVNTLKKDWTPTTSLSHVLTVIRCLLIVPFPESSLNDEAGKNFMESYDEYARRAKLLAGVHGLKSWSSDVYNDAKSGKGDAASDNCGKDGSDTKSSASLSGNSENAKAGKSVNHSNIARSGSKTTDKKSKKKSLKRL
mmetsp:Transcript_23156/g.47586  ORF Transcript_23156/g.47586 Transcript_23156/m.47586 type:complete len:348 (+) Transcript_23156:312-1355(+)